MDAKRATLRDAAAAAGVSRALAGFVLGDDHGKSIPEPTPIRWLGKFDSTMIRCNNQGTDCREVGGPR